MHSTADKAKVRHWIAERHTDQKARKPLPSPEQLRRELGVELIEQARTKRYR